MKQAEVLNKAADILEEKGWCQRDFRDSSGRRCVMRAIEDAALLLGNLDACNVEEKFRQYLGVNSLIKWNDDPRAERNAAQVITKLRECANAIAIDL